MPLVWRCKKNDAIRMWVASCFCILGKNYHLVTCNSDFILRLDDAGFKAFVGQELQDLLASVALYEYFAAAGGAART